MFLVLFVFLMVFMILLFLVFIMNSFFMNLNFMFLVWDFLDLFLLFNFNNLLFFFILMLILLVIFLFSIYYMNGEFKFNYFFVVLLIFVLSMIFVNFSYSTVLMLVSWDLLGISSFFLVLFYNNWDSASGSLNTVLTNRLGDFFLFIFFGGLGLLGFSFLLLKLLFMTLLIFLVLGAFTKSAIFPFSGWLPKAMSAPTPVSALVHSSTLVTAGMILLLKFDLFLIHYVFSLLMMLFGLFTMFFSSLTALVEEDMKKVVALSTLSQMGFLMMILGLNYFFFCFLHLLSHALFKSCLFIQVGYIMHNYFSQQDSRNYFFNYHLPYYMQFQMLITLFCLTGLFFSSGMVSKDIILESVASLNSMFYFFLILGVLLTFFYSFRLWLGLMKSFLGSMKLVETTKIFNLLSLPLFLFSLMFMFFLKLNYIFCPEFFLYLDFFIPLIYLMLFIFLINYLMFFFFYYMFYKFLVDFFPKWMTFKLMKNFKFFDLFLFKFFNMNLNFVFNLNFFFLGMLKNLNWGTLMVFIVFLLLFF